MTDLTVYATRCNQAAATAQESLSNLATALRDSAAAACLERAAVLEIKDGLPTLEAPTDPSGPLAAALVRAHQELDLARRELARQSVALVNLEEALIDMADEVDSAAGCLPCPRLPVPAHLPPTLPDSETSTATPFPFELDDITPPDELKESGTETVAAWITPEILEQLKEMPEIDRRLCRVSPNPNAPSGFSVIEEELPTTSEETTQVAANPPEEEAPPPAIQAVPDVEAELGVETPGKKRPRGRKKGAAK